MNDQPAGGQCKRHGGKCWQTGGPQTAPPRAWIIVRIDHDTKDFQAAFFQFGPYVSRIEDFADAASRFNKDRSLGFVVRPRNVMFHQAHDGKFVVRSFDEKLLRFQRCHAQRISICRAAAVRISASEKAIAVGRLLSTRWMVTSWRIPLSD